jgi:hypothetical protein
MGEVGAALLVSRETIVNSDVSVDSRLSHHKGRYSDVETALIWSSG